MNRPDFFVVGAPKCGTSTLYHHLRGHPQVFMPGTKEPHHFSVDVHVPGAIRRRSSYLRLFDDAGGARRVGEASVSYLASRAAPELIRRFRPGARAVVMLRDPLEVMRSLHAQLVFECEAEHPEFARALELQERHWEPILAHKGAPYIYREAVRFADQLERYLARFGPEQVHVILLDELLADPDGTWQRCLEFLDLDPHPLGDLVRVNPRKQARSPLLQALAKHPPGPLGTLRDLAPQRLRQGLGSLVTRINATPAVTPPLDPDLRHRLLDDLRPEIERLAKLIDRDLRAWVG